MKIRGRINAADCLWAALALTVLATAARAADFCVENTVSAEEPKEAASRSTTVFYGGAVYDFMADPLEVIVFDKASGRFDVLDMRRRVRLELSTADVVATSQRLKERTEKNQDPLLKFLGAPKFEEQFDEHVGELTLTSPWMVYRVRGKRVENPQIVQQYHEFSDWLAQLNWLLNPGARPPFSRLALNEALEKHNLFAQEVQLTAAPRKGTPVAKQSSMRSQHQLATQVAPAELTRIQQARQAAASFKRVSLDEYRLPPAGPR
jgi:hypothetical protein